MLLTGGYLLATMHRLVSLEALQLNGSPTHRLFAQRKRKPRPPKTHLHPKLPLPRPLRTPGYAPAIPTQSALGGSSSRPVNSRRKPRGMERERYPEADFAAAEDKPSEDDGEVLARGCEAVG